MFLIEQVGVATVPGDNFYATGNEGDRYLRFAFCRSLETLQAAIDRLRAGLRSDSHRRLSPLTPHDPLRHLDEKRGERW